MIQEMTERNAVHSREFSDGEQVILVGNATTA
jgi:hypothetical protein